jgi:hypothetical protein
MPRGIRLERYSQKQKLAIRSAFRREHLNTGEVGVYQSLNRIENLLVERQRSLRGD